jgi:hypothetical protein
MKKIQYFTFLMLLGLAVTGCSSNTSITGSYVAPGVTQVSYKKIFISALTDNTSAKQTVESSLANQLNANGVAAVKSIDVLPPNFRSAADSNDKELLIKKIREGGCDGILTVALMKQDTETRYVEGNPYPVATPYYGYFGSYYNYGYANFYSPGYYTNDKVYYLETNLYDAATEKLVWSAQSKTYNPSSLESFMQEYQKALAEQIAKDGLIAPKP